VRTVSAIERGNFTLVGRFERGADTPIPIVRKIGERRKGQPSADMSVHERF